MGENAGEWAGKADSGNKEQTAETQKRTVVKKDQHTSLWVAYETTRRGELSV